MEGKELESNGGEGRDDVIGRYVVDRPAHTTHEFEKHQTVADPPDYNMIEVVRKCARKCTLRNIASSLLGLFPIIRWLACYRVREWLPGDLIAGITVGVVHIPQSMAFSILAGLAPVFGLYTSFYPVLIYTLMGTSRHISVGTFAITSLLTQSVVLRLAPDVPAVIASNASQFSTVATATTSVSPGGVFSGLSELEMTRISIASAVTFLVGLFQLGFGLLRLGFITSYLSAPLIQAFTIGAALHVVASQTPFVLGFTVRGNSGVGGFFLNWIGIFSNLPRTHVPTLIISIVCIVLLVAGRHVNLKYKQKLKFPIPSEVLVVAIAILASHFGLFESRFGVRVVADVPTGFPAPIVPDFSVLGSVIGDAFAIAVVGFVISVSLSKLYSQRFAYTIDPNQEMLAYGFANVIPAFFYSFPSAAALARCEIQVNTGGKTQVVGIVSIVVLLVTILWLGPVFEPLPRAVLGCIIIVGLLGILGQITTIRTLYRKSKVDGLVWIVTLSAVLVFGVDIGLLFGVVFSILTVIARTQRPHCEVLGSIDGSDIYRCCDRYSSARQHKGIVIFKFNSVLYYANKDLFKRRLIKAANVDPDATHNNEQSVNMQQNQSGDDGVRNRFEKAKSCPADESSCSGGGGSSSAIDCCDVETARNIPPHTIIVDCASMSFVDLPAVEMLKTMCQKYNGIGISMHLTNVNWNVRKMLSTNGYYEIAGDRGEFLTVHDAVLHARADMETKKDKNGWKNSRL